MMISYPIENRPHINWKHIDGPLLTCRDGTPHWLTYWERIAMFFGQTSIEELEAKIMRTGFPIKSGPNNVFVPNGWKLVPIEPTEDMVIAGFESVPDRHFDGDNYPEAYDEMSGCQQAAFRAKRCYAAMLSKAPKAGT